MKKIKYKKLRFSLVFFTIAVSLFFSYGCGSWGGGGGIYFQPQVSINSINVEKIRLDATSIKNYHKAFFPVKYSERDDTHKVWNEGYKKFGKDVYFQEINFHGTNYYIKQSASFSIEIIRKKDMKLISDVIKCPRYIYVFAVFVIKFNTQEYLAIYVKQQPTSHSSTFFLLNSDFKIVYEDHLLGAEEIGTAFSEKFGNGIVVKSEDWWFKNGLNKPKVKINGDWFYYRDAPAIDKD